MLKQDKWMAIWIAVCMLLSSFVSVQAGEMDKTKTTSKNVQLTIHYFYQKPFIALNELRLELPLSYQYRESEGTLTIQHAGQTYELLRGTTIIARNGIHLPLNAKPYFERKGNATNIYVPLAVVENAFALPVTTRNHKMLTVRTDVTPADIQTVFASSIYKRQAKFDLQKASPTQIAKELSFMKSPIAGAKLSTRDNHLPGAPRKYRNGTHEGLDWYSGYSGIRINRKTAVRSVAQGVVVRIDSDYVELKNKEREKLLAISAKAKQTPTYILDQLRGRSIWVQYEKGVLVRYAHLHDVNKKLVIGSEVKAGELLGLVGNSGTSSGVAGNNQDLHLHMDILIHNQLFWQHLKRTQIRQVLANVFGS